MNLAARTIQPASSELRERIQALGPWFHNIDLGGVWTAPDHFLGDYPGEKFRRFAPPIEEHFSHFRHTRT